MAPNHVAIEAIGMLQESRRQGDLTAFDGVANYAAADGASAALGRGNYLRRETELPSKLRQRLHVARLPPAEAKIFTHQHRASAQFICNDLPGELLRRE